MFWANNCIFYAKDKRSIGDIILSVKIEFLFEREENLAGFLGIQIEPNKENNKITLMQTGLTDQILEAMYMVDCNIN